MSDRDQKKIEQQIEEQARRREEIAREEKRIIKESEDRKSPDAISMFDKPPRPKERQ